MAARLWWSATILRCVTAERFWIEEIVDPRKTRSLLCEFARLAEPIRTPGPARMAIRPYLQVGALMVRGRSCAVSNPEGFLAHPSTPAEHPPPHPATRPPLPP